MLMTTQDTLVGHEIVEVLGIAQGNSACVQEGKHQVSECCHQLIEARREAVQRIHNQAKRMGADAIVAMRFDTAAIMQSAAEVFVYGTAVKIKKV